MYIRNRNGKQYIYCHFGTTAIKRIEDGDKIFINLDFAKLLK